GGGGDVARALLAALVIGERATLPDEVEAAFRRAGVTHVLSVSGLHLAAVAFVLLGLTTALAARTRLAARVPAPRLAALVTAPLLVLYALATGAAPATMRALAMALLALTAVALGRGAHVPTVIAAALAGWAVAAPGALADPSLQLSFAAVIALACTARPLRRLLERRWPLEPPAPTRARRLGRRATRAVVQLVLASAAATLAGLPISALHFGTFSPAGVVTNVVVVPLAELVIIPLGLAGAALGAIAPVLGQLPLAVALTLTRALLVLVRAAAAPAPELAVAAPTLLLLVVFYAALGVALAVRGRPRLLAVAAALLVVAHLGWPRGARAWSAPRGLRASFLDVGQGDATLLELPSARILIDAGGSLDGRGLDPGERAVLPALRARHIAHLELVVISHPHPDHIGGLLAVARAIPIDTLWWSGDASGDPRLAPLLAELAARGTFITRPPLRSQLGGADLDALHPQAAGEAGVAAHIQADDGLTTNDNSLVIRVRYAGRALLFPGDLEAEGEDLARAYAGDALRADVLKLPHHGSRTSSTDDFLDAVHPDLAVLSCGAGNRFGFPHPEVSARLAARAIRVLRTDRMGGITISIAPDGTLTTATTRAAVAGQW
ncbi:MAG: DNA internalization-related competence protein ComEC/Rec2, partial [Deltaproteobacteria bacterium]|nr:DNA internalization-related competence protein ComEC/Rec2 [Deltaproteobacteria bacterium]